MQGASTRLWARLGDHLGRRLGQLLARDPLGGEHLARAHAAVAARHVHLPSAARHQLGGEALEVGRLQHTHSLMAVWWCAVVWCAVGRLVAVVELEEGGGGETAEVSRHAATNHKDTGRPVQLPLREKVPNGPEVGQGFRVL